MFSKFRKSVKHATHGVYVVAKDQRNFRIQIAYAVLVAALGFVFDVSLFEWFLLSLAIVVVFIAEMTNTITEYLCNLVESKKDIQVQYIKDIAAGVVLIAAFWAVIIGAFIFLPKFITLFVAL